jgi:hypothetical protein
LRDFCTARLWDGQRAVSPQVLIIFALSCESLTLQKSRRVFLRSKSQSAVSPDKHADRENTRSSSIERADFCAKLPSLRAKIAVDFDVKRFGSRSSTFEPAFQKSRRALPLEKPFIARISSWTGRQSKCERRESDACVQYGGHDSFRTSEDS